MTILNGGLVSVSGVGMDDFEYTNKLVRLLGIVDDIKAGGVMAMAKHKAELMDLAPDVLVEAATRHGLKRAVNVGEKLH